MMMMMMMMVVVVVQAVKAQQVARVASLMKKPMMIPVGLMAGAAMATMSA